MATRGNWWRYARQAAVGFFLATAVPVLVLRWVPAPGSMFMVIDRVGGWLGTHTAYPIRYHWIPSSAIAAELKLAVVASEDQKFSQHLGFDLTAIQRALARNQSGHRIRGGSTITQQTAKNLFLYSGKSYLRKALEAYFTLLIEIAWPKQRILEVYLNIAEFGPGIFGADAASRFFFQKTAAELNTNEAALMAASLPNPRLIRIDAPSAYMRKRQAWIRGQMQRLGGIPAIESLKD